MIDLDNKISSAIDSSSDSNSEFSILFLVFIGSMNVDGLYYLESNESVQAWLNFNSWLTIALHVSYLLYNSF